MSEFKPNYQNIVDACLNKKPARIPLYDHSIAPVIIERLTGKAFADKINTDKDEYFKHYCNFFKDYGYDTVTYEANTTLILPNGGALTHNNEGCIKNREDFEKYPFDKVCDIYFEKYSENFHALRKNMPDGMLGIGGVGNGIFECVQDIVGYEELCYIRADDEELFADLFKKIGDVMVEIWTRFLKEFGDLYCVCRMGDDLGFNTATLLDPEDIRKHIIPQYKRVIKVIHDAGKPFLLHSCGAIFEVMPDLIHEAKIDSKHSNEDAICDYAEWITKYGDKIGNFGGIDTDVICGINTADVEEYTTRVYRLIEAKAGGGAIGSGNSIPNYVEPQKYLTMMNTVRKLRGDFN